MGNLILIRHGQSLWNELNLFTGWVDVGLSSKGQTESVRAGELLLESGFLPDVLYTSVLTRAIQTANLALLAADMAWLPVVRSWRANERHYGALQGKNKAKVLEEFGPEQFGLWRRGYETPPPPIEPGSAFDVSGDRRYLSLPALPCSECLKDVLERFMVLWREDILPDLRSKKTVLIVAHGNSLRALVKYLEGISDADISSLNIPTGVPLVYAVDSRGKALGSGQYLDPAAAKLGAGEVANQGKA